MNERRTDPQLGEDLNDANDAQRNANDAPFGLGEKEGEGLDEGLLEEDLEAHIEGLPAHGAGQLALLAVAHLATLTARVSRITVTFTCPG